MAENNARPLNISRINRYPLPLHLHLPTNIARDAVEVPHLIAFEDDFPTPNDLKAVDVTATTLYKWDPNAMVQMVDVEGVEEISCKETDLKYEVMYEIQANGGWEIARAAETLGGSDGSGRKAFSFSQRGEECKRFDNMFANAFIAQEAWGGERGQWKWVGGEVDMVEAGERERGVRMEKRLQAEKERREEVEKRKAEGEAERERRELDRAVAELEETARECRALMSSVISGEENDLIGMDVSEILEGVETVQPLLVGPESTKRSAGEEEESTDNGQPAKKQRVEVDLTVSEIQVGNEVGHEVAMLRAQVDKLQQTVDKLVSKINP